jgi:hypothetical protein
MGLQTTYSHSIHADPRLEAAAVDATNILRNWVSDDFEVNAHWDRAADPSGSGLVNLTLSDFSGRAAVDLSPAELLDRKQMVRRLNRVWGSLLQTRLHKQVESLFEEPVAPGVER